MKDFFRRNGLLILIAAILLALVTAVVSALLGGTADPFSNLANILTTPVRNGINAVVNWTEEKYSDAFEQEQLKQENEELKKRVSELEEKEREYEAALQENERLRNVLELRPKERSFDELESAMVTARETSNWASTLTLSKGSAAGIAAGNCVITETGVLVGVVSEVGTNWCTVSTVINTDIEMGGIVTRTYSAGVLEGDFSLMSQGKLKLNYLPEGAQLVSGDEVLTSGKGDVYPSGLVVGQVEGVFTDPSGMTRYAVVTPDVDLSSLIEVFVIKDFDIVE